MAIAPDGKTLASSAHDQTVKLWRDGSPESVLTFDDLPGLVERLCFASDGATLATCYKHSENDCQVFLWPAPREGETPPEPTVPMSASAAR